MVGSAENYALAQGTNFAEVNVVFELRVVTVVTSLDSHHFCVTLFEEGLVRIHVAEVANILKTQPGAGWVKKLEENVSRRGRTTTGPGSKDLVVIAVDLIVEIGDVVTATCRNFGSTFYWNVL